MSSPAITLKPSRAEYLRATFTVFARVARKHGGVSDQELAEWLFALGARWLVAHGVSPANIHAWIAHELSANRLAPLVAAAAADNDFGGRR
jgi:hypothetical protein